jgi:multiple sugar transport system substrate-binding protein
MALNRRQVSMGGLGLGAAAGLSACAGLTGRSSSDTPSSTGPGSAVQAELSSRGSTGPTTVR